jgi:hypothetical protein
MNIRRLLPAVAAGLPLVAGIMLVPTYEASSAQGTASTLTAAQWEP